MHYSSSEEPEVNRLFQQGPSYARRTLLVAGPNFQHSDLWTGPRFNKLGRSIGGIQALRNMTCASPEDTC